MAVTNNAVLLRRIDISKTLVNSHIDVNNVTKELLWFLYLVSTQDGHLVDVGRRTSCLALCTS